MQQAASDTHCPRSFQRSRNRLVLQSKSGMDLLGYFGSASKTATDLIYFYLPISAIHHVWFRWDCPDHLLFLPATRCQLWFAGMLA